MLRQVLLGAFLAATACAPLESSPPAQVEPLPVALTAGDADYDETRVLMTRFLHALGNRDFDTLFSMLVIERRETLPWLTPADLADPESAPHYVLFSPYLGPLRGGPLTRMPQFYVFAIVDPRSGKRPQPDWLSGCVCREDDCRERWPADESGVLRYEGVPYRCVSLYRQRGQWWFAY